MNWDERIARACQVGYFTEEEKDMSNYPVCCSLGEGLGFGPDHYTKNKESLQDSSQLVYLKYKDYSNEQKLSHLGMMFWESVCGRKKRGFVSAKQPDPYQAKVYHEQIKEELKKVQVL